MKVYELPKPEGTELKVQYIAAVVYALGLNKLQIDDETFNEMPDNLKHLWVEVGNTETESTIVTP